MINLLEYLLGKNEHDTLKKMNGDEYYEEPPMTHYKAEVMTQIKWYDVKSKMEAWNAGTRKENIKACKDAKLIVYYVHCKNEGYTNCCDMLEQEANRRGWTFTKLKLR